MTNQDGHNQAYPVNQVRVVGWVQGERVYRDQRASAMSETRTETQGRTNWLTLHVPSPFGASYALDVHVTARTVGRDALDRTLRPGALVVITGQMAWMLKSDARFARDALDAGRPIPDMNIIADSVASAAPDDAPGCDVWLCGTVRDTARVERHAEQPIRYYQTRLDVAITQTRPHTNARFTVVYPVDVAIPLNHPDAPRLIRRGNTVAVVGLLERTARLLARTDDAVVETIARKQAALEAEIATLHDKPRQQRAVERRTEAQIRELRRVPLSRVVVGQVTLLEGKELDGDALKLVQQRDTRRRVVTEQAITNGSTTHHDGVSASPRPKQPKRRPTPIVHPVVEEPSAYAETGENAADEATDDTLVAPIVVSTLEGETADEVATALVAVSTLEGETADE